MSKKPKKVDVWAVVDEDGYVYDAERTKAEASACVNVGENYRVVRLVEYDPTLVALAKAAVKWARARDAVPLDTVLHAIARYEKARKKR